MDTMNRWMTGEAKQRFSEVLRRCVDEPQRIYNRSRLVAAVISAQEFEQYERWREARRTRTLGEAFSEVREICERYDYELDTGERRDRKAWEAEED